MKISEHELAGLASVGALRWACENGTARRLRQAGRLHTTEVARLLSVTPSAVSKWERGLRLPTERHAAAYLRLLERLNGGPLPEPAGVRL
ncbi:MAG: helix-turn-helix transcriptional regulator [Micropruina sp.]|uniref:helix-turn-helix domain-containing protein n=1 Tax=Micropruina sp. TaxID=2737536 RepID=UPI0039E46E56